MLTEIPLSPQPLTMRIPLGQITYRLTVMWRDAPWSGWVLDIYDDFDAPLACGLPLVTGEDLLGQFAYLNIPGLLFIATDGDPDAVPTFNNLGLTSHLFWLTPDE